jgi:hypothetical protein
MEGFSVGFVPTYPSWLLREPQYIGPLLAEHVPEAQLETIVAQATAHDANLVKAETGAFGALFIPDLATGAVEGVGHATLVDSRKDIDIDKTLRRIRIFNPGPGAKPLSNTTGRLPDARLGPAAMHLVEMAMGRDKVFVARFDYWVFTEPRQAIKVSTTYWDPERYVALVDAVLEYVAYLEPAE